MLENEKPDPAEAEGRTVDEAVRKALIATGWKRDQITVDVLEPGGRSTWETSALARIRLRRKTADALDLAQEVTAELLKRVGLAARVKAEQRPDHIHVQVQGEHLDEVLLSQDGEPLDALQHLVSRIVSKRSASRQMVSVDLGGYRERRERDLRDLAYRLADEVRETGQQILTDPMGASERRVIHLALNEDPDITTFAIGDGLVKQIAIAPIDQAPSPEERRSSDRRGRTGGDRGRPGDRRGREGGDRFRRGGPGGRGPGDRPRGDRGGQDRGPRSGGPGRGREGGSGDRPGVRPDDRRERRPGGDPGPSRRGGYGDDRR